MLPQPSNKIICLSTNALLKFKFFQNDKIETKNKSQL